MYWSNLAQIINISTLFHVRVYHTVVCTVYRRTGRDPTSVNLTRHEGWMNRDALAHSTGKTHVTYFSLEHTPTISRVCG